MVVVALLGCGGADGSSEPSGGTDPRGTPNDPSECTTEPRPALGAAPGWKVCVDSGLDEIQDQFSFENWGGPPTTDSFTPDLLVSIFGYDEVCMPNAQGCVVYPAAQQWMDQMNAAIEGGRCEGMATLSQRILLGRDTTDLLQPGAAMTSDLARETWDVGSSIAYWWASQTFDEVRATTSATRELPPSGIVDTVVSALRDSAGPTLGLYGNGYAHAVTPVAVSTDGAGSYVMHVYDNNYPGRILPVYVDTQAETWSYDMAAANSGEESDTWTGGAGTLDVTLLDSRDIATSAPWSESSVTKGSTVVTASTRGLAVTGLLITAGETTVDTRDTSSWIDGVSVFPLHGVRAGTGVTVVVDPSVGPVSISPSVDDVRSGRTAVDLLMTIDFPGQGSVQFESAIDFLDVELPSFSFEGSDEDYSLRIDGDGEFLVEYAYGEEESDFDLLGDVSFEIDETNDGAFASLFDSDGGEIWTNEFDGKDDDGFYGSFDFTFDDETGFFVESETEYESFEVSGGWNDEDVESQSPEEEGTDGTGSGDDSIDDGPTEDDSPLPDDTTNEDEGTTNEDDGTNVDESGS